ncbi:MAG: PucR family transcriptional regulator [Peptococcaceae bacterium]
MGIYLPENDPFKGIMGLDSLAERISQILKCPVTIEDANHRLLAYSAHDERTDPARIATIIGRRVPEKVINSLWREGVIPYLLNNDEPLRIKAIEDVGLGNRVAVSVRKNQETLGFIWVHEMDYVLQETDLANLMLAARSVKNYLINIQLKKKAKDEGRQEFFWQLLTSHFKTEEEIVRKFEILNILMPQTSSVIVFKFPEKIDLKLEKSIYYVLKTTQRIKIVFSTISRNHLILLGSSQTAEVSLRDINKFCKTFIAQMQERFQVTGIAGGCGTLNNTCQQIAQSYQEALAVLEMKGYFSRETKNIYTYQDLGIYRFLPVLLEQRKGDLFENQAIRNIIDYDQKHKTELLETLEVYLENDCSIHDTAEILHVHANTLNYRLKRISEIGEINLKDANQKMTVVIDLKMNKLKEQRSL